MIQNPAFSSGGVPDGAILLWSGAVNNIPEGFALCDGTNGTPDLRNRFVVGAGNTYDVGDIGGSEQVRLIEDELPVISFRATTSSTSTQSGSSRSVGATPSTVTFGGGQPHENRPPYYALCYIMKVD